MICPFFKDVRIWSNSDLDVELTPDQDAEFDITRQNALTLIKSSAMPKPSPERHVQKQVAKSPLATSRVNDQLKNLSLEDDRLPTSSGDSTPREHMDVSINASSVDPVRPNTANNDAVYLVYGDQGNGEGFVPTDSNTNYANDEVVPCEDNLESYVNKSEAYASDDRELMHTNTGNEHVDQDDGELVYETGGEIVCKRDSVYTVRVRAFDGYDGLQVTFLDEAPVPYSQLKEFANHRKPITSDELFKRTSDLKNYTDMLKAMAQDYVPREPSTFVPPLGVLVAVPVDPNYGNDFERGQVVSLNVDEQVVLVDKIDCGGVDMYIMEDVYPLKPCYAQLPPLVTKISIQELQRAHIIKKLVEPDAADTYYVLINDDDENLDAPVGLFFDATDKNDIGILKKELKKRLHGQSKERKAYRKPLSRKPSDISTTLCIQRLES